MSATDRQLTNRRAFLRSAGLGAAALGVGLGCDRASRATPQRRPLIVPDASMRAAEIPLDAAPQTSGRWQPFTIVEAQGEPEAIGETIGRATADSLRTVLSDQREWLERLRTFAFADREARFATFIN